MKKNIWPTVITIGLAGQIAWTVENMYFNVFLYNTISQDPGYIASMVALSAVTATLTTIVMGTLSDKTGRRKPFMTWGYIVWAITVSLFAFVSKESFRSAAAAATAVVVLDCVMTFFGSTANDAVFNAYITENVERDKRSRVEAVVQIMPMASMLIVFGALDGMTQKGEWKLFFLIVAGIMFASGILSFFFIQETERERKETEPFLPSLIYGFRPTTLKENRKLYLSLLAFGVNALGMQVFYPYLIIYVQNYLGFNNYALLLAVVLVASSVLCVILGRAIDKKGRLFFAIPAVLIMALGMVLMFFSRAFVPTIISGIVMMAGYLVSSSVLSALIRDYTPQDKEGGIQGVRMVFQVMVPMVLGPYLGAAAIKSSSLTYTEFGSVKSVPTPLIFLIAAFVTVLSIVPVLFLKKEEKR
ncbi:MAG: MFS transporter [Candidatus Ornithospirochaeta sp.]